MADSFIYSPDGTSAPRTTRISRARLHSPLPSKFRRRPRPPKSIPLHMDRIYGGRRLLDPDPDLPASLPWPREAAKPGGGARVLSFVLRTLVMFVALLLFFLFAGVAAVVLLHLSVAGRAFRRGRRGITPSAADDASPPCGLSPAQLKGLPWFEYTGRSASPPWPPPPDCAVCLERVKEGERCRALPPCGHVFHVSCVDRWLVKSWGCPMCRARVGAETPEPSVSGQAGWM